MSNPFSKFQNFVPDIKRNTYDMTFQNHLTFSFGMLTPCCVLPVNAGETFRIKPTFALNFMPTLFPLQTKMKAYLHFFYVRNRNLWKDYPDFRYNNKPNLVPPYHDFKGQIPQTGSLYDYLGLPTTLIGDYSKTTEFASKDIPTAQMSGITVERKTTTGNPYPYLSTFPVNDSMSGKTFTDSTYSENADIFKTQFLNWAYSFQYVPEMSDESFRLRVDLRSFVSYGSTVGAGQLTLLAQRTQLHFCKSSLDKFISAGTLDSTSISTVDGELVCSCYFKFTADELQKLSALTGTGAYVTIGNYTNWTSVLTPYQDTGTVTSARLLVGCAAVSSVLNYSKFKNEPLNSVNNPYYDSSSVNKDKQLKIDAYAARAYESVYNAFYRDSRNNPYMINGQPEYNKYLPTVDGGVDTTPYSIRYRNWEQDFLTTCLQSPQQGMAPLVGITPSGTVTYQDENGIYTANLEFEDDNETVRSFKVTSQEMPQANLRSLMDFAASGISINDLRNVNALQRWLENNLRRGLKYRDQVKAHTGVDISYQELDMPEFIGGYAETVYSNQVNNMTESADAPLGDYAGQLSLFKSGDKDITNFCDEDGFIIGIISVVPVPVYSQVLPKHFLKHSPTDYFSPEFGHLGMQPVYMSEVAPVQAFFGNRLNDLFGYQRPWYDEISKIDEVHGQFRTTLRNFLMNRVFSGVPELSEEFLLVNPDQCNNVFAITDDTDKIVGNILFQISKKSMVPLSGIASL